MMNTTTKKHLGITARNMDGYGVFLFCFVFRGGRTGVWVGGIRCLPVCLACSTTSLYCWLRGVESTVCMHVWLDVDRQTSNRIEQNDPFTSQSCGTQHSLM